MDALLIGTGGADGWPAEGCSCAACMRARAAGVRRAPGQVVADSALTLLPGKPPRPVPGGPGGSSGHHVVAVPGGWDITGPDGGRLLAAAGPGQAPEPPDGTPPFDLALLDLLTAPAQLGLLRARGLIRHDTMVATLYTDDRVTSEQELDRRCALWGVLQGRDGLLVSGPGAGQGGEPASRWPAVRPHRTLILGGARSGKSREAELRLSGEPSVTYLAAGPWADESWAGADGNPDAEWVARVAAHRAARPSWWVTLESLDVAGALRREQGALLIDGMGTWLAAVMDEAGAWEEAGTPSAAAGQVADRIAGLLAAWRQASGLVVAVSDQVGAGLVPPYPAGRAFRDQLGWLNQRLAAESDLVLHVVAGRVATLPA